MGVMDRVLLPLDAITRNDLSYGVITAIILNNPLEITTSANHGLITGDRVYIAGIVGTTEINDQVFTVTKKDADEITLDGVDGTSGHTAWTSGGEVAPLIGSMGNISHGSTEGMAPLLNSTGKFDADRLPAAANSGLARAGGQIDLSTVGTSNTWTGIPAGTSIMLLVLRDVIPATTSTYVSFRLGHGGGPTWITTGYTSNQGFRISSAGKFSLITWTVSWLVPGQVHSAGAAPPISAHVWFVREGTGDHRWSIMCNTAYGILSATCNIGNEVTGIQLHGHLPASAKTMTGFAQLFHNG